MVLVEAAVHLLLARMEHQLLVAMAATVRLHLFLVLALLTLAVVAGEHTLAELLALVDLEVVVQGQILLVLQRQAQSILVAAVAVDRKLAQRLQAHLAQAAPALSFSR